MNTIRERYETVVSALLNEGCWLSKVIAVVAVALLGVASVLLPEGSRVFDAISVAGFVGLGAAVVLFTESKVGACRRCGQEMHAYCDYCPWCGEQVPVEEWDTAGLPDPGASVVASEYGDHVIVYEEDREQGAVSSVCEIDAETWRDMREDADRALTSRRQVQRTLDELQQANDRCSSTPLQQTRRVESLRETESYLRDELERTRSELSETEQEALVTALKYIWLNRVANDTGEVDPDGDGVRSAVEVWYCYDPMNASETPPPGTDLSSNIESKCEESI
jgi:RNA polymerase subunit RPABC4/transcription elongation factor Spt4